MCNKTGIDFVASHLSKSEVFNKNVLEVGAYDVNGSIRPMIEAFKPASYLGVDIAMGPGVDRVCDAGHLTQEFGYNRFDVLICMEMLEHVRDWRTVISNLKNILSPGGILILSTRSKGFVYHGYPYDFWRFEPGDMQSIFSDFQVEALVSDTMYPGVFIKVQKPHSFTECRPTGLSLYSIMTETYRRDISSFDVALFRLQCQIGPPLARVLPSPVKKFLKRVYTSVR